MKTHYSIICLALLLVACAQSPTGNVVEGPISLGVILPITGAGAYWGIHTTNAMHMAIDDINEAGGINGRRLALIEENGQCDPKTATTATQKLININKVPAIIGEVCSSASNSMAPFAQDAGVVMITPCSEAYGITEGRDYIFRTWTPTNVQGRRLAQYVDDLGVERAAILSINNDFGESVASAFATAYAGEIVAFERYQQDARDLRTELSKINAAAPQLLLITSYPPDGVLVVKQMNELGMQVPVVGTTSIASKSDFIEPLGALAEGIRLSDMQDSTTEEFWKRYKALYGEWPGMTSCASVAYDDVMLLAEAMRDVGTDSERIKEWLHDVKNYPGASGPLTFNTDGNLERDFNIYEIKDGEFVMIE